jgi:hypothetical protein
VSADAVRYVASLRLSHEDGRRDPVRQAVALALATQLQPCKLFTNDSAKGYRTDIAHGYTSQAALVELLGYSFSTVSSALSALSGEVFLRFKHYAGRGGGGLVHRQADHFLMWTQEGHHRHERLRVLIPHDEAAVLRPRCGGRPRRAPKVDQQRLIQNANLSQEASRVLWHSLAWAAPPSGVPVRQPVDEDGTTWFSTCEHFFAGGLFDRPIHRQWDSTAIRRLALRELHDAAIFKVVTTTTGRRVTRIDLDALADT